MQKATMDEDYGLLAYKQITAQISQWGESAPPSTSRKSRSSLSSGGTPFHDAYEAMEEMGSPMTAAAETPRRDLGGDVEMEESPVVQIRANKGGGVETPMPIRRPEYDVEEESAQDDAVPVFDGVDTYQPYRDALLSYIQNRRHVSNLSSADQQQQQDANGGLMQIDDVEPSNEDASALQDADIKFLDSLAAICFARNSDVSTPDNREGSLWDLMSCLRSRGLQSLFYCVDGETPRDYTPNVDPKTMIDASPAEVIQACLCTSEDNPDSLPLERLNASLEWIQSWHDRKWKHMLSQNYETSDDPMLPPPRRRSMWPSTLESIQRNNNPAQKFHPDAPQVTRTSSPTHVALDPTDEADDARLLRACFILFQAGKPDQALKLTTECGQPWRSIAWLGGEPLDESGRNGNPTRRLWKRRARTILRQMMKFVPTDGEGGRRLYSSLAYEAAILAVLSDNVDCAAVNPVFQSWEDGVHAILSAERGIIEENVLLDHDDARVDAVGDGSFVYPGMEGGNDVSPGGYGGDMAAALQKLNVWSVDKVREGSDEPFRNGMRSFLVGREALKEYIEEVAALAMEFHEEDEHSDFFRFVVHLVLYVDIVMPEFAFQLKAPDGMANDGSFSWREELLLKYTSHLCSMRELWGYVPLYTSLLSQENILTTFSDFLVHVHTDQERKMMLTQARDFFPTGLDRYVLRNVVREMIQYDKASFIRGPGEEAPPAGITPADNRMIRAILWLCYYEDHHPDALVCANMLLRRFMLEAVSEDHTARMYLHPSKHLIWQILPRKFSESAVTQAQEMDDTIAGYISMQMVTNLQAEFLSVKHFLQAHDVYVSFLDVVTKTSPCHRSESKSAEGASSFETEIAQKMERNAFRQKKTGLCKIVIEYATKASNALVEVLTFGGGWMFDVEERDDDLSDEAKARSHEIDEIRSVFVPMAVFMLHEVLNKTAMWMEQVVYDTLDQFGDASPDMLMSLFAVFDESEDSTTQILNTSLAAPAYWHKQALSIASIVANDDHALQRAIDECGMKKFLKLMADSQVKYNECSDLDSLFDL